MLKRCQILLSAWMIDYMKDVAERHDLSFSEVVRIFLCEGYLNIIPLVHPGFKTDITSKKLVTMTQKSADPNTPMEERHKLISKLYFEARKATEYRMTKVKKQRIISAK